MTFLQHASNRAIACSATDATSYMTFATIIPLSVAASTSILSTPIPYLEITFSLDRLSITFLVIGA